MKKYPSRDENRTEDLSFSWLVRQPLRYEALKLDYHISTSRWCSTLWEKGYKATVNIRLFQMHTKAYREEHRKFYEGGIDNEL